MKKQIVIYAVSLIVFCFANISQVSAQYHWAIGLRAGPFMGATVKYFAQPEQAIEGIINTKWRGYQLIGLYEWHWPIENIATNSMTWYVGCGGHIATYNGYYYYNRNGKYYNSSGVTTIGIDGVIGLEYTFSDVPFVIGADGRPFLDIINPGPAYFDINLFFRVYFD